jgi:FtsP/CotA-like multicopper oxidase with cupredoxin domain
VALASCGGSDDDKTDAKALDATTTGAPFTEPQRAVARDGVLEFDLVASDRGIRVAGADVRGRAYADGILGPTLVAAPGDTIKLTLDNQLNTHTNIHFHGMHVSPQRNGDNIFLSVDPGQKFDYSLAIPRDHPTGTFWYHSHAHTISESQVFGGLSGMIIVDGIQRLLPPALRNIKDIAIGLKDAQVVGDEIEGGANIDSNAPTLRVVNSHSLPVQTIAPGEVQLWRLANIGADIWYDVELEGQQLTVIGEDGNPVWEVWTAGDLLLPPGKRYDVLVTGPAAGEYTLSTKKYEQGDDTYPDTDLMTLQSEGTSVTTPAMPTSLVEPAPIDESDVVEQRTMEFSENEKNEFFINGKSFDANRVDVTPKLGTVEEWTLTNTSDEQHPFHIHVNDFQVISIGGEPYTARGLQDTVPLLPGKDVVIRTHFTDFTGKFVFHCHILNHEDNGMMAVVEVVR